MPLPANSAAQAAPAMPPPTTMTLTGDPFEKPQRLDAVCGSCLPPGRLSDQRKCGKATKTGDDILADMHKEW